MKRFAFITDLHLDEKMPADHGIDTRKNLEIVLKDISSKNIKDIVIGGDIAEPSALNFLFTALNDFSFNLILGNHDSFSTVSEFFTRHNQHSELYYTFEDQHENVKYIFLDSSSERISQQQLHFLESEIQTQNRILLFIHHPVLDTNTAMDIAYPLKNRDDLKLILQNSGRPVYIFTGHYHMNDEQTVGNITQSVTHAVSFQVDKHASAITITASSFGYRIIEIDNGTVKSEVITFS